MHYFDSTKHTDGSRDISSQGIGFALTQNEYSMKYGGRALTSTEQKYSQIAKELLALVLVSNITITTPMAENSPCGQNTNH